MVEATGEVFVAVGQGFELGLHLGFQGGELGLVAALSLFGEGLEGFPLALVGLLAEGVTLFEDSDVELELLLALVLAALEPAAEDLQEGGASADGGDGGDHAVGEVAHARGSRDLQAIAVGEGNHEGCPYDRGWRRVWHHGLLQRR